MSATASRAGGMLLRGALGATLGLSALCVAWELVLSPLRPGGSWLVLKEIGRASCRERV